MATQAFIPSQRCSEFSTTDPGEAVSYFQEIYGTTMRFEGAGHGHRYAHTRMDGGMVALDEMHLPVRMRVAQEPFLALLVVTVREGHIERTCGARSDRVAGGDVFIHADPSLPTAVRVRDARFRTLVLQLSALRKVAEGPPASGSVGVAKPVQFTGLRPVSSTAADLWRATSGYLAQVLADPVAADQPLLRGAAARLAAAAALSTFPNNAVVEPAAMDRRDATNVTIRRAAAFIEQDPSRDISIADIASAANVSIRTVQEAFRRHLGTTPMRYLRAVRLDCVHRELRAADPAAGATVTAIAARWGFHHHHRFVSHYRQVFRMNPADTLRES